MDVRETPARRMAAWKRVGDGQRVATAGTGRLGEVVVEVDVGRARQVAGVVALSPTWAGEGEAGVDEDGVVGDRLHVDQETGAQHQDPNGSGSGERATACARAAVSRRRWCWRHSTS